MKKYIQNDNLVLTQNVQHRNISKRYDNYFAYQYD